MPDSPAPLTPPTERRRTTGAAALTLVIIANALSLAITVFLIAQILSVPPFHGGNYLLGVLKIPNHSEAFFLVGFAVQVLLAAAGIWGLVLGIIAIARKRQRSLGVSAVVIAVLVPLFSLGAFWILALSRLTIP